MKNSLEKIIILDLEATCWQSDKEKPKNETNDIIEVGISIVNLHSLSIETTEGIMVKPERSTISKYCTDLTTITQAQVDKGVSFKEACFILQNKYHSKTLTWISWGSYDRRMFESQCREMSVEYPFSRDHLNLKNMFSVFYGKPKEYGMEKALDMLNISLEGTHHVGKDDAYNTAKIFIHMLKQFRK